MFGLLRLMTGLVTTVCMGFPVLQDPPNALEAQGHPRVGGTTAVDLGLVADVFDADVRMLVLGDSFAIPGMQYRRVFPVVLKVWTFDGWTALEAGAWQGNALLRTSIDAGGEVLNQPVEISSSNQYQIENADPDPKYFALPTTFMQEVYADADLTLGGPFFDRFFQSRIRNVDIDDGINGSFTDAGDVLRARVLYYCPDDIEDLLVDVTLDDNGDVRATPNLRTQARKLWHKGQIPDGTGTAAWTGQINAAAVDIDVVNLMDAQPVVNVREHTDAGASDGDYLTLAGMAVYHVDPATGLRMPGLYYSSLSDASWSYFGFGSDEPSSGDKVFTLEQFTHWLDVTTLAREQKLYVFYYLAAEPKNKDEAKPVMEAMIDQTQAAADAIGIGTVRHCLVIPHMHAIEGVTDLDTTRTMIEDQRDAAFEIAHERSNVAAASIYDATDGVMFDGSTEARNWLDRHGYDAFHYGTYTVDLANGPLAGQLLDWWNVHPDTQHGAAFFASILGDLIENASCLSDINDDSFTDSKDFIAFLNAFVNGEPIADLNGDGAIDSKDFIAFLDAFASGC